MASNEKIIMVYVARHGTTVLNADGCFRGNRDVPLDDKGRRDASRLGFYFQPIELSHIVTSDRLRAMQTAKAISAVNNMEVHPTSNLRAWNVGDFSGKPKNAENCALIQQYIDNPDIPIPGGESLGDFKARVGPAILEAVDIANESGQPLLLVAHSSIVREVGSMLYGNHHKVLVHPGGVIALYAENGQLQAEPIFKAKKMTPGQSGADTIS